MSIKDSQQLKQLQSRKAKLEVSVEQLEIESKEAQKRCSKAQNQLKAVCDEIESLRERDIVVTEHALLRYVERVLEVDLKKIRSEILNDETAALAKKLGNGKYPIGNGHKAVVKGMAVVSIV